MNVATPSMGRAVGAYVLICTCSWGDAPRWDGLRLWRKAGPLALNLCAAWTGDSDSANGAPPSQPGATPQVKGRKQNEG